MEILANKEKVPFQLTNEKTLGELISSLLILCNQANKVVLEVSLDGKVLPLEERNKFENQGLDGIEKIELKVESKLPIAIFALEDQAIVENPFETKAEAPGGLARFRIQRIAAPLHATITEIVHRIPNQNI